MVSWRYTVQKTSYFGDEWNYLGEGEDGIDGGGSIYIWCKEFVLEINEME